MSETLTGLFVDALTGETVERELTNDEIEHLATIQLEIEAQEAETEAKIAARASALAKLAELGLTEEELAAL